MRTIGHHLHWPDNGWERHSRISYNSHIQGFSKKFSNLFGTFSRIFCTAPRTPREPEGRAGETTTQPPHVDHFSYSNVCTVSNMSLSVLVLTLYECHGFAGVWGLWYCRWCSRECVSMPSFFFVFNDLELLRLKISTSNIYFKNHFNTKCRA